MSTDQEAGCITKTAHNQALGSTLNSMFAALVILLMRGRIDWMEKVYISADLLDVAPSRRLPRNLVPKPVRRSIL